jgi:tripartite-type tricarboxylate transporter receptor subunit TctC
MRIARRALALLPLPALAQARPVRLLVPFGAGGISDVVARIIAEPAARALGQPIIIENRPGAGGNIAGEALARAAPDGLTLMLVTTGIYAANPLLYPRMPFDPLRDFEPVALAATSPHVLVTAAPFTTLAEMLAAARARPEALSWSTAGVGSSPHQSLLLLQSLSATKFLDVHFRSGAEGVQAVLSGQASATAEAVVVLAEQVRAGTLRALCVAGTARVAQLPAVPTAAEAGLPGFENGATSGITAPRGVAPEVLARLTAAFAVATRDPAALRRLEEQGSLPLLGGPAEFNAVMARETAKWAPLLAGLRAG